MRHWEEFRRVNGLISVGGGANYIVHRRRTKWFLESSWRVYKEDVRMALINRFEHLNKKPHHEKAE